MGDLRDQFEEKYKKMHSADKCTLMQNGNYSGWFKQACWDMWQAQHIENQSRIDELQKRLITQGQNFNDQSQRVRDLKFKGAALQKQIDDSENTRAVLYRENMDLRESGIELEKQLSTMKYINDEQAAIIQGHLDARIGLQNKVDELSHWNNNQRELIKRNELHAQGLKKLLQNLIDDCYTTMRPSVAYEIQKALQGDL